jgi:hypothetical protein
MKKIVTPVIFVLILLIGVGTNAQNKFDVQVSPTEIDSAEPVVTAAPDGGVYVVWVEHQLNKDTDIFLQKYDAAGKPVGTKTRINPEAGHAFGWRGDPPGLAIGKNGEIFVVWTLHIKSATSMHANNLLLSVSRDGGKSFLAPVKINDDKVSGAHAMNSILVDKKGRILVVWLDERYLKTSKNQPTDMKAQMEANREVYFAVSDDGGKSFSPNKKIAADACPCCKTSLVAAPNGRIYLSWRQVLPDNYRHIAVASSNDNGNSFSAPTIVSDDRWQIEGCPVSGASLATTANNILKVAWFSGGTAGATGVYESESTDGGKTFAARRLVREGSAFGTPVFLLDERGNSKSIWGWNGKIQLADAANSAKEIAQGTLPSAAMSDKKLFIAYVNKEGEQRSVRLSVINDEATK